MKKYFLLSLFLISALMSCEKSEELEITETINASKIEIVQSLEGEEQKVAYRLLNNFEKHYVWNEKMNIALLKEKLNKKQRDLILEIKEYITPNLFMNNVLWDESKINEFDARIRVEFDEKIAIAYFATISLKVDASLLWSGCGCSQQSNWCGFWTNCDPSSCRGTDGCGFMGLYDCNGDCEE